MSFFPLSLHIQFAWRLIRYVFLGAGKRHVSGGGRFGGGRSLCKFCGIFNSTLTTVDSKGKAEGVSGYDETWVTGE